MKFRQFSPLKAASATLAQVAFYLSGELGQTLRDLQTGLQRLTFTDNFEGFIEEVTIPAGQSLEIRNKLDTVPKYRIILRSSGSTLDDGTSAWNMNFVYLRNTGGASVTATVLFLK